MADPFSSRKSLSSALSTVKTIDFYTEVYGPLTKELLEAVRSGQNIKPPKTRFVPSRQLFRKMMRAVVRFGDHGEPTRFLMRFGLVENNIAFLKENL